MDERTLQIFGDIILGSIICQARVLNAMCGAGIIEKGDVITIVKQLVSEFPNDKYVRFAPETILEVLRAEDGDRPQPDMRSLLTGDKTDGK